MASVSSNIGKRKTNGLAAARKKTTIGLARVRKAGAGAMKNTIHAAGKKVDIGPAGKVCKAVDSLAVEANAKCGKAVSATAGVANGRSGVVSMTMEWKARANGKVSAAGIAEPKAGKAANPEDAVGKATMEPNTEPDMVTGRAVR